MEHNIELIRRKLSDQQIPRIITSGYWNWEESWDCTREYMVFFGKIGGKIVPGVYQIVPIKRKE